MVTATPEQGYHTQPADLVYLILPSQLNCSRLSSRFTGLALDHFLELLARGEGSLRIKAGISEI